MQKPTDEIAKKNQRLPHHNEKALAAILVNLKVDQFVNVGHAKFVKEAWDILSNLSKTTYFCQQIVFEAGIIHHEYEQGRKHGQSY